MEDKYFIIDSAEGEVHGKEYTKEELLKKLKDNWWGDDRKFYNKFPEENDLFYWDKVLIIKGKVITPKTRQVIVDYDIE